MSRIIAFFPLIIVFLGLIALSAQPVLSQTVLPKNMEGEWYNPVISIGRRNTLSF